MWIGEIITPWIGRGTGDDSNRPQIGDDYRLALWEDVTGQHAANLRPDPNMYIVRVECDDVTLDRILADGTYYVLSAEERPVAEAIEPISIYPTAQVAVNPRPAAEVPDAAEFGLLMAYLSTHRPSTMTASQWRARIRTIIGNQAGYTRQEMVERLVALMKEFPRVSG